MKNKFKSIMFVFCTCLITLASVLALSACGTMYHSKAGTMQDMTGTYKLTTYVQKDDNGNEIDRIADSHVQAYLVVGADGHGYYAYQDDDTEFWYDTILINYNHETEGSNLYKSIQFTKGVTDRDTKIDRQKPGNGYEPTMGFNVNNKTFNYFIPDDRHPGRGFYPSYYTDVIYTKISTDTDLSKVTTEFNRPLDPLPRYELKNLNGILVFSAGMPNSEVAERADEPEKANNPLYNKYKYYVINFDAVNEKADCYYELVDDNSKQIDNDVTIPVTVTTDGNGNRKVTLKFFDQDYTATISAKSAAPMVLSYEVATKQYADENGNMMSSSIYINNIQGYYTNSSIENVIDAQLAEYNRTHN